MTYLQNNIHVSLVLENETVCKYEPLKLRRKRVESYVSDIRKICVLWNNTFWNNTQGKIINEIKNRKF